MKKHEATVYLAYDEIDRVNRLLAIESLDDMTDDELFAQGASTCQHEGIFCVKFDDGSSISFDLCSGIHNYWDDVVWTSSDGSTDVVLDCEYEIGDIEAEIESELYIVRIVAR